MNSPYKPRATASATCMISLGCQEVIDKSIVLLAGQSVLNSVFSVTFEK